MLSSQWHVHDREDHAKLPCHQWRWLCARGFNILSNIWYICCLYLMWWCNLLTVHTKMKKKKKITLMLFQTR